MPDGGTLRRLMGEMGRKFDGGYAEYTLLPNSLLMPATMHSSLIHRIHPLVYLRGRLSREFAWGRRRLRRPDRMPRKDGWTDALYGGGRASIP
ncbi:hypothetical protein CIT31_12475 [Mesorhizobium wenxiniae]|uniref:Uncharacterized protein n=1 Tax=Mesorhizobium wenxiniae TaxID=2014805 RepID=A0A271KGK8_9HYPH|nr:hypothetical protein CIT31_12475 [Mesorhizobium wenxiniae]